MSPARPRWWTPAFASCCARAGCRPPTSGTTSSAEQRRNHGPVRVPRVRVYERGDVPDPGGHREVREGPEGGGSEGREAGGCPHQQDRLLLTMWPWSHDRRLSGRRLV